MKLMLVTREVTKGAFLIRLNYCDIEAANSGYDTTKSPAYKVNLNGLTRDMSYNPYDPRNYQ